MPWRPSDPSERPTLGYEVIDWIAAMLAAPDKADYEPFVLYPEQEDFVLNFYELDPRTCKRKTPVGALGAARGALRPRGS